MNRITFPGFNLEFNISRVAFSIFNIEIYWYAILMVSAFAISLIVYKLKDGKYGIKFDDILNLSIITIPISLLSARLYYIIFKLDYYMQNPIQILNFRTGGLAIYGGLIGGAICCFIYCKKKKINLIDLLDYIVLCLPLGQCIGRWGNFINVEAYGTETTLPWRMGIYEMGKYIEVHPTFLYESICTFLILVILILKSNKRKFKGEITLIYLITYSFARMIIEGMRTDSLMLGPIRISQLLSLILFVVCIGVYLRKIKSEKL